MVEAPAEILFDETRRQRQSRLRSKLWSSAGWCRRGDGASGGCHRDSKVTGDRRLKSTWCRRMPDKGRRERTGTDIPDERSQYDKRSRLGATVGQDRAGPGGFIGARSLLLCGRTRPEDSLKSSNTVLYSNQLPSAGAERRRHYRTYRTTRGSHSEAGVNSTHYWQSGLLLWIEARLTEQQMREVEIGHQLTFSSDGRGDESGRRRIIWVSRFLDPHSRTGTVRARVLDGNHNLHAGEFGRVRILGRKQDAAALVPKDAVQWEGCCNVVFVKESVDRFRPRKVHLIASDGPYYRSPEECRSDKRWSLTVPFY